MARPLRINYSGAFYHVTSRGNERKDAFNRDFILGYFGGKVSIAQKGYRNFVSTMVNEKIRSDKKLKRKIRKIEKKWVREE